ncbi:MAG: exodeoxyribonuclease VII small subunit [Lachnospiraceae bacterium]|jgi:exodeoxyribonuclease VII small subunit|nr:exodeoxyribonuclease VII small subunit [Lachnospiraceae bacterium]
MAEQKETQLSIEEVFEQLDEMLMRLEAEEIPLEEAFLLYEKGMKLLKYCDSAIDKVEKKVLLLQENGETYEF